MSIRLNEIVPWGRSRAEYAVMFRLTEPGLTAGVLDCGGGPASFTSELSAQGFRAVSVDPIYAFSGPDIRSRFEAAVDPMLRQVRATPENWVWSFHRDPDDLLANRRTALERFLSDYEGSSRTARYIVGALPRLPLSTGSFGLALCSHFLFLYSDLLSESFHVDSVRELCRVAREVRIFPLLTNSQQPSPHVAAVRRTVEAEGWRSEIVSVEYELQRGGNQMLRIFR